MKKILASMFVTMIFIIPISAWALGPQTWQKGICPANMVQTSNETCTDIDKATAPGGQKVTFGEAAAHCGDNNKRLCDLNETYYACLHAHVTGVKNYPKTDAEREFINGTPAHHTYSALGSYCESVLEIWNDGVDRTAYFRCCTDIEKSEPKKNKK